jgi:hypothetical protein
MTNSVTFPPALGGDGSTVTDDADITTGLANGGHRTLFIPALSQTVVMANTAAAQAAAALAQANAAAASAATATAAAGTNATSTTSLAIGLGAKTLTVQTGKSIVVGMQVLIANTAAPSTKYMRGVVTGYVTGTGVLNVSVDYIIGSGTLNAWTVSLTGVLQPAQPQIGSILYLNSLYGAL